MLDRSEEAQRMKTTGIHTSTNRKSRHKTLVRASECVCVFVRERLRRSFES